MPTSPTSGTPPRRVGVYERLKGERGSPAKIIGIAAVVLIILIVIIALLR